MKLFHEVFEKEIESLKEQDKFLDQEIRSILSHAMLGDDSANEIKKETFDLMVEGISNLIWDIHRRKYQITKTYKCSLDEMQCSEECHGNRELMDKCSCCKVTSFLCNSMAR